MSYAGTFEAGVTPPLDTLTGNVGGVVGPDGSANIDILGAGIVTVTGTPASNLLTISITDPVPVANGGTGAASLTDHGILVGSGTAAVTALAVGTNGQLCIGSTGADPVFADLTSTGATITITGGAGTLNIDTAGSGGFLWTEVTGVSQAMAVGNGYIANNAGLVTLTLPVTAAVGDCMAIVGKGAGGWTVAQNAGQTIHFLSQNTTTGVGGSLSSTVQYDCLEIVCTTADTDFVVRTAVGNITVV